MTNALPLTKATLATLLRSLDEKPFAEFVADFWLKMGWRTETDGGVVTARRDHPREETRRLRVVPDGRSRIERLLRRGGALPDDLGDVDAVVLAHPATDDLRSAADNAGVEVIDSEELFHRLMYAVDRRTCRSLCRRHLGRAVEAAPPERRSSGQYRIRVDRLLERARGNRRVIAGAAVALVFLFAFATLGVIGGGDGTVVEPGGGEIPESGVGPSSPVGIGSTSDITDTVTPTGRASPTPDIVDRALHGSDELPDAIAFRSPEDAVIEFIDAVGWNTNRSIRIAWLAITPDTRPPYPQFVEKVRDGEYRPLLDRTRIGVRAVKEVPDSAQNGTSLSLSVAIYDGTSRSLYGFNVTCVRGSGSGSRCWRIVEVSLFTPLPEEEEG